MDMPKHAVVAGHICLDVIPDLGHLESGIFTDLFQPGHLITVGRAHYSTGGPVSNTGLALQHLGIPTQLIAKTGDDAFGQVIRDLIAERDSALNRGIVVDPGAVTSYSVIISPPGIDRIFLHCPGANDSFGVEDVNLDLVLQADLFHFGYPPIMKHMYQNEGDELATIFRRVKATGITTSLDMAFPDPASEGGQVNWRRILQKTLPSVDIFVPSIEEILFMLRRDTFTSMQALGDLLDHITPTLLSSVSEELMAMGAKIVLLKLGHQGAYLRTAPQGVLPQLGRAAAHDLSGWGNLTAWAPCFEANVVGTTGAGDATIAGFLGGMLRDMSAFEALTMGVAVGACNVETSDALSGLRTWDVTRQRIAAGWSRRPLDLSADAWQHDEYTGIWFQPA